jgi:hypothetical protein
MRRLFVILLVVPLAMATETLVGRAMRISAIKTSRSIGKERALERRLGTVRVACPERRRKPCLKTLAAGLALFVAGRPWHSKRYADEQSAADGEAVRLTMKVLAKPRHA